jgi:hypothetical protein
VLRTERLRKKLTELGFHFKRQADRVMIYARGTQRVTLPRSDLIPEEEARQKLDYIGLTKDEISTFIAIAKL